MKVKKKCRELLKINNKLEKGILKENNELYTDMIVYIRGSEMTNYDQELVRGDLIQMIIDGQNRGDNIENVIGENYKNICDEIIETMPKRTKFQKILLGVEHCFSCIWILGMISIGKIVIWNWGEKKGDWKFILSIGDIINMLIVIFLANVVVNYICKTALVNKEKNRIVSFLKTWIGFMIVTGIMVASAYYLNYTLINISLVFAIVFVVVAFICDIVLSRYTM